MWDISRLSNSRSRTHTAILRSLSLPLDGQRGRRRDANATECDAGATDEPPFAAPARQSRDSARQFSCVFSSKTLMTFDAFWRNSRHTSRLSAFA